MNDRRDEELDRLIEETVRSFPRIEAPESLRQRIEGLLRDERTSHTGAEKPLFPFFYHWRSVFAARPRLAFAMYTTIILLGIAAGAYIVTHREDPRFARESMQRSSDDLYQEARSDIQQAMFFYERAIMKLSVLAERNEKNLDPRFVELQKEKISMLRASIAECKAALEVNQVHPQVQHYLLTAYTELQTALQELAHGKN